MERSHSYTSFETTGSSGSSYSGSSKYKSNNYSLNRTNSNNSASNNITYNNYKNKFASTSSLNLRKALEMRQTQLQMQQQQQREQLQRQQWLLLYEQRRQQQQLLQQQQFQQLQHAQSSDSINAPLFLSSLNGLQLLQQRRQKMLQRQKSTSADEIDFPLNQNLHTSHDDDDEDVDVDEVFDVDKSVTLREHSISKNNENYYQTTTTSTTNSVDDDENQLTLTANNNNQLNGPLQQKLSHFQRQRPLSEAAIRFRASSPLTVENLSHQQSQSVASSPTTTSSMSAVATATAGSSVLTTTITTKTERRRLNHCDQSLSFDSAIGRNANTGGSVTTATPSTANISTEGSNMSPLSARHPHFGKLKRDNSLHSDSSRYSSVDSLLESRKPDPEAILINLGFGPIISEDILSRIPKRFLKPSQLRGIDTDAFVRRLQLANNLADHSVLGYRGLIGNPDLPPSSIVAKIMQRFEVNERKKSMGSIEQTLR